MDFERKFDFLESIKTHIRDHYELLIYNMGVKAMKYVVLVCFCHK
jgi:hypothetical protein